MSRYTEPYLSNKAGRAHSFLRPLLEKTSVFIFSITNRKEKSSLR